MVERVILIISTLCTLIYDLSALGSREVRLEKELRKEGGETTGEVVQRQIKKSKAEKMRGFNVNSLSLPVTF